jgi:hypothetical protein
MRVSLIFFSLIFFLVFFLGVENGDSVRFG